MSRPTAAGPSPALPRLRAEIERVDARLVELIAERVALAREAGVVKAATGLPVLDPAHEAAVVRRAGETARASGLEAEEVREIFWQLIGLSRRAQTER